MLIPSLCISQIPDPVPNSYVHDFADKLTSSEVRALNDSIRAIELRSSVQIAIVIVNDLPENMLIDEYSNGIGRKWHVGNANNGLVYVAALNNKKQRLEVARELQSIITDLDAKSMTDPVRPLFRNAKYYDGMQALLTEIKNKVDPIAKAQLALAVAELQKKQSMEWDQLKDFCAYFSIVILFGIGAWWVLRKKKEDEPLKTAIVDLSDNDEVRGNHSGLCLGLPPIKASTISVAGAYLKSRDRSAFYGRSAGSGYDGVKKKLPDDDIDKGEDIFTRTQSFAPVNQSPNFGTSIDISPSVDYGGGNSGSDSNSGYDGGGANNDLQ